MTAEGSEGQAGLGERFKAEMRDYAIISFYLWICFGVLLLYKTSILRSEDIDMLPFGLAAVKALILGKFVLIGKAVKVGSNITPQLLWRRILWKSFAFLVTLIVFTAIEELVVGMAHGHSVASIVDEFTAKPLMVSLAPALVMLLVLIPMITFEEVDHDLGKGTLKRMLFGGADPESAD